MKRRYLSLVRMMLFWNNVIRYIQYQKIGKPNTLEVFRIKKTEGPKQDSHAAEG
jgi:hypothetical protein